MPDPYGRPQRRELLSSHLMRLSTFAGGWDHSRWPVVAQTLRICKLSGATAKDVAGVLGVSTETAQILLTNASNVED